MNTMQDVKRGPIMRTHPLTGDPIEPVGYVGGRAVWPVMGGSEMAVEPDGPDDEVDDPDAEDEADEDEGDEPAPAAKKAPAADRLKADIAAERKKRRAAESELRRLKAEREGGEAESEAARARDEHWSGKFKVASARVALATAGVPAEKLARAVKLLDMEGVDVDEDGEVHGLDAEVELLKDEMPELFGAPEEPPARRAPRLDASGKPVRQVKQSSADKLAAALMGN